MKWKPQPRQVEFMSRPEDEVFYGGAAGGGKSDALVIEALRQIDKPEYNAIIFRKTYKQLDEIIKKSQRYYRIAEPRAKYNASTHVWTFPSGATIHFGSMPHKDSYFDYQGRSYAYIGFDELTHFTWDEYSYMFSRNRADGPGIKSYIRATGNPGGIGHGWVKERFITSMPPDTTKVFKEEVETPDGGKITVSMSRRFVPSLVFDNKALLANDPKYLADLASLPEAKKKALLYGDWNSFSGQVFTEWRDNPDNYKSGINTHVTEPFDIPREWKRYRTYDFGYTKPFAFIWAAMSPDGIMYIYREYYGATDTPNEGIRMEAGEQAEKVREIEDNFERGNEILGVADPAIWDESRGKSGSVIEAFTRHGIYFEKGKNARLSGKMEFHNRLRFDKNGKPMLYVFSNCRNVIRTIPNLIYAKTNVEDVDTECEDHIYDAMRYLFMAHPVKPERPKEFVITPMNPLL